MRIEVCPVRSIDISSSTRKHQRFGLPTRRQKLLWRHRFPNFLFAAEPQRREKYRRWRPLRRRQQPQPPFLVGKGSESHRRGWLAFYFPYQCDDVKLWHQSWGHGKKILAPRSQSLGNRNRTVLGRTEEGSIVWWEYEGKKWESLLYYSTLDDYCNWLVVIKVSGLSSPLYSRPTEVPKGTSLSTKSWLHGSTTIKLRKKGRKGG